MFDVDTKKLAITWAGGQNQVLRSIRQRTEELLDWELGDDVSGYDGSVASVGNGGECDVGGEGVGEIVFP
jgi:hypothetical protein